MRGDLHGVKVCKGAPSLTHLLVDDCFLFCRVDDKESRHLQDILKTYEVASGQAIKMEKSEIFFNRNTSQDMRDMITCLLGVNECIGKGKYFGLPAVIGRNKKQMFGYYFVLIYHIDNSLKALVHSVGSQRWTEPKKNIILIIA